MQFSNLLPELSASLKQRRHDLGKVWHALDKFEYPFLKFDQTNHANLEPKVTQQAADIILDGDGLLLQQLAGRQNGAPLHALCGIG
jgi:hypothetical protein